MNTTRLTERNLAGCPQPDDSNYCQSGRIESHFPPVAEFSTHLHNVIHDVGVQHLEYTILSYCQGFRLCDSKYHQKRSQKKIN